MILLIITGYAGTGKSTASLKYAKKNDLALINQDHFLFEMNPSSLIPKKPTKQQYDLARRTLLSCVEIYMKSKTNILLEGALVPIFDEDPINISDFLDLTNKYSYQPILITLVADDNVRRRRQARRGNILAKNIDKRLIKAREKQDYKIKNYIIDTSKLSIKKTIDEIDKIVKQ